MTSGQALLHVAPLCFALLSEVFIKAQVLQSWASYTEFLVDQRHLHPLLVPVAISTAWCQHKSPKTPELQLSHWVGTQRDCSGKTGMLGWSLQTKCPGCSRDPMTQGSHHTSAVQPAEKLH